MQSRIRCRLYIGSSMYDVTNDLINWDDIYSKLKRQNYGGVMRSFAGKFEFARKTRAIIRQDLLDRMMYSVPRLVWYERNENWAWKEVFSYVLDISSYDDDGSLVSISAVDDSLANLIKAKRGMQYEYSVDETKENKQLYYDRMIMSNMVKWIVVGNSNESNNSVSFDYVAEYAKPAGGTIPVNIMSEEISYNEKVDYKDFAGGKNTSPYDGFFVAKKNISVSVSLSLLFTSNLTDSDDKIKIVLYNKGVGIKDVIFYNDGKSDTDIKIEFTVTVLEKMSLSIAVYSIKGKSFTLIFKKSDISCTWFEKNRNEVYIDVITPTKLLSRLLRSMNGGKEGLSGEIESSGNDRLENCLIVAAESARGLKKAKLYSSFSKFAEWMSAVFGFVYEIDGNIVRFIHRNLLYDKEVVKSLGGDVSEFSLRIEPSLIYSQVNVGYDKQDYDSVNGRDEFRFTTEYSSGIILTDNKLELISPYRADAYGIEFLVQKRGKNTTDKESDNDVFFVGAQLNSDGSRYELIRGGDYQISGVISAETMFNAMYSPRQMLMVNKNFIGVSVDKLEYASSNGNSEVMIAGVSEKDSVLIDRREALFMPMSIEIQTSEQDLPNYTNGLISIERDGAIYRGFIDEIEIFHGKSKSNSYKLVLLDVSGQS